MRLSQDDSSWKASGLKRRDFRHTHDGPEATAKGRKKNGKKWCRGKPGRVHTPGPLIVGRFYDMNVCTTCGKQLSWHWKATWAR